MKTLSSWRSHGGTQGVHEHQSEATGTPMRLSVFVPDGAGEAAPVLTFLSGLTCTHENVTEKGEYRAACAEHGVVMVCPDTSPRGEGVPDDPDGSWDFGLGAGFYLDASEAPYAEHYRMEAYVTQELPRLLAERFPIDLARHGLTGHSMGGHGALTLALKHPDQYRAVSAFAPVVAPSQVPWGQKALPRYLGDDPAAWARHDAVALIESGAGVSEILVDQGEADAFLEEQLKPELLEAACEAAGIPLTLRRQPGYDHSYYFISSFMADHVAWHAARLKA